MNADQHFPGGVVPATDVVDSAVGVPRRFWFIAIVKHNSEMQVAERLGKMGITTYVPAQTEVRVWRNGRKSKVQRIVIPSKVFIHCSESERRELVKQPFIFRFMTDKASTPAGETISPVAHVPDREIRQLKFMLGQSDIPVSIVPATFRKGEKVRVVRGGLKGLEGEVMDMSATQGELLVQLSLLGCARLLIDTVNLEHVD